MQSNNRSISSVHRTVDTVSGGPPGSNGTTTSSESRLQEYVSFTVTNGLVKGVDRAKPNPINYVKLRYTSGTGSSRSRSVMNGTYWDQSQNKYVPYSGFRRVVKSPIMEAAGNISPGQGLPAQFGWGYPDNLTVVRDAALSNLLDKIRKGPNLAVDFAERRQTISMLRDTLRFREQVKKFVRGLVIPRKLHGKSRASQRMDYITGKWMEYRYGWSPLMGSVFDAFDQLMREVKSEPYFVRGRAGMVRNEVYLEPEGSFNPAAYVSAPATGRRVVEWSANRSTRCEMKVWFAPTSGRISDWTTLNPANIAWELLPFSFVLDWFVNVGQFLSDLESSLLMQGLFLDGYRTDTFKSVVIKRSRIAASSLNSVYPNSNFIQSFIEDSNGAGFERTTKDRQKLTSLPLPSGIHWRVNLNAKRLLDAAVLTRNFAKARLR